MPHQGPKNLQPIPNPPRTTWEVCEKDLSPGTGQPPGEGGKGCGVLAPTANSFRESGSRPVQKGPGRLRRHVSWAESGSTGRENDVHSSPVSPSEKDGNNGLGLVRDGSPVDQLMTFPQAPILQQLATGILALPPAACVGDRENPNPERAGARGGHRRTVPSV